jgi:putative tryptophan/tyrosine transport system substrate-binding protein
MMILCARPHARVRWRSTSEGVGLFLTTEAFFTNRRNQIITLAARYRVPACYAFREFTAAGGFMSYGASLANGYRQVGLYVGQILKGAKPGDLPIQQSTKFELVINLKTVKALGLTVAADELIE